MAITIYGIPNCDTMKKARDWLSAHGVDHAFHNYKVSGIEPATLRQWAAEVGWQTLLNKAGTTFKALPDTDKQDIDEEKAIRLMAANPSMIKRPVLEADGRLLVGFEAPAYEAAFAG